MRQSGKVKTVGTVSSHHNLPKGLHITDYGYGEGKKLKEHIIG